MLGLAPPPTVLSVSALESGAVGARVVKPISLAELEGTGGKGEEEGSDGGDEEEGEEGEEEVRRALFWLMCV